MGAIKHSFSLVAYPCVIYEGYLHYAEAMLDAELTVTPCMSMQNISSEHILVLHIFL